MITSFSRLPCTFPVGGCFSKGCQSQLVLLVQDLLGIGLVIIREARDHVAFSFLDGSVNGELKLRLQLPTSMDSSLKVPSLGLVSNGTQGKTTICGVPLQVCTDGMRWFVVFGGYSKGSRRQAIHSWVPLHVETHPGPVGIESV